MKERSRGERASEQKEGGGGKGGKGVGGRAEGRGEKRQCVYCVRDLLQLSAGRRQADLSRLVGGSGDERELQLVAVAVVVVGAVVLVLVARVSPPPESS